VQTAARYSQSWSRRRELAITLLNVVAPRRAGDVRAGIGSREGAGRHGERVRQLDHVQEAHHGEAVA
jgi:hypothetical protein